MSHPRDNDNNDENNPFVAFRKAIDNQAASFFSILTELPIQLSAIQEDLRKDGEAATENIQSALRRLGDAYERSTNPERRSIEDGKGSVSAPPPKETEKETVYTKETQKWQEENFRTRWSLDDGEFKFPDLPKPPSRRAWPDRSFFAFSPYSPLALEQRYWHNPWTNPHTYRRRGIIWRDAFEDLLRTTQAAQSQTDALAEYKLQLMVLEHQKNQRLLPAGNTPSDSSPPLPLYRHPTPARWLRNLCKDDVIDDDNFHTLAHLVDTTTGSSSACGEPAKFPPTRDPYRDAGPLVALAQRHADAWIREHPTMYPSGPLGLATTTTSTTTVRTSLNDGRHVTSTVTETHFPDGSVQTTSDVSQQVDGATAPAKERNEEWEERLKWNEALQERMDKHEELRRRHWELRADLKQRLAEVRQQVAEAREASEKMREIAVYTKRRGPMEKKEKTMELGLWPEVDRRIYRAMKRDFEEEMRQDVGWKAWDDDEEEAEGMPDVVIAGLGDKSGDKSASGNIGGMSWSWITKWDGQEKQTKTNQKTEAKEKPLKKVQEETPEIGAKSASGNIGGVNWSWSTKWGGEEKAKQDAKAKEVEKEKEKAKTEVKEHEAIGEKEKEKSGNKSWSWYWSW